MGVIKKIETKEPTFLARPQRAVIQIIYYMVRVQQMTPEQSATHGNTQGIVVRLCPTLYSPWGLNPTDAPNTYYMFLAEPHRHLEGNELAAAWDLTISIIYASTRKMIRYWWQILTETTPLA